MIIGHSTIPHESSRRYEAQKTSLLRGIIPPLMTPLTDWQTLDVAGLERLVERLISGGVHGLFLLGTTGEGPSLSYEMRRDIIKRVTTQVGGRIPILVAVTDTSLKESLNLGEFAAEHGCKALVAASPYYHPITQTDLKKYLVRLGDLSPLPLFMYNMPSHTKTGFDVGTLKEAFDHPKYIGLKDSSGDLEYFFKAARLMKDRNDLTLLIGPEHLLVPSMKLGGHGGICGGAHLLPRLFVRIYDAIDSGNMKTAEKLEKRLFALGTLYNSFPEASFLGNMKCALALMGLCKREFAEPLHPIPEERHVYIKNSLEELGIDADTLE